MDEAYAYFFSLNNCWNTTHFHTISDLLGVSHKDVLINFFKAIDKKEENFISAEEGLKTLEIVEKMYGCA